MCVCAVVPLVSAFLLEGLTYVNELRSSDYGWLVMGGLWWWWRGVGGGALTYAGRKFEFASVRADTSIRLLR